MAFLTASLEIISTGHKYGKKPSMEDFTVVVEFSWFYHSSLIVIHCQSIRALSLAWTSHFRILKGKFPNFGRHCSRQNFAFMEGIPSKILSILLNEGRIKVSQLLK